MTYPVQTIVWLEKHLDQLEGGAGVDRGAINRNASCRTMPQGELRESEEKRKEAAVRHSKRPEQITGVFRWWPGQRSRSESPASSHFCDIVFVPRIIWQ